MAVKLPTWPTPAPMRGLPLTTGSLPAAAAFLILARPPGESASPARSGTTLERSRMRPSASRIPGFSRPGGPKRNSFMTISSMGSVWLAQTGGRIMRRTPTPDKRGSERPREGAAVDQQVLAGDVAGLCRAQERAGGAELVGRAEAFRRNRGGARRDGLVDQHALLLGIRLDVGAQPVGVEGAGQQKIDGDVRSRDRSGDAGHERGQPGARAGGEIEPDQRHL